MRLSSRVLLVGALAVGLGACREPAPVAPEADAAAPTAEAKPVTATDRRDPGPLLERPVGVREAVQRPAVTLEVDAVEAVDGAVYLRALVPRDPRQVIVGPLERARVEVVGDRHGVAVPAAQGRLPDRPWVYVRLAGDAPPPDPLVVRWRQAALLDGEPGQVQILTLVGAASAAPFPRLSVRVHEALGRWFADLRGGPPTLFHAFAAGRLPAWRAPVGRARSAATIDLMQIWNAPWMTLVLRDRGMRLPEQASGAVPLEQIEPPRPVGSPWAELAPKAAAPADPLAAWAPAEWIYLRLTDLAAGLALYDEAAALFGPVAAALTNAPGQRRWFERLSASLGLDRAALDALAAATGGVSMMLTDPMIEQGPGLVMAFEITDDDAAERALNPAPDARAERVQIAGRVVTRLKGAHGTSFRATVERVQLLSNSAGALERVFAARGGERALADAPGFAVLRGRLAATPDEVLFAMAGEGQLQHLAAPRTRLLAARRARAMGDLRAVDFAGLLYGWLEGRPFEPARDTAALRASGLLTEDDLTHDDGGRIALDGGVPCSAWGCAGRGRPLIDLALTTVNASEAGAYARLRTEAFDRLHTRVAPMALRVVRQADGYRVAAQMLPLPRQHGWRWLTGHFGDRRLPAAKATASGLEVELAVGADAPLRAQLDAWLGELTGQRDVGLNWLGDSVALGLVDRSGAWDAVLNLLELPNVEGRRIWRDPAQRKQVLTRLPLSLRAPVADRAALDRALVGARVFADAPGSVVQWRDAGVYRGVKVAELRERLSDSAHQVGLFFGVAGETLVAGVERAVFEATIDRVLDDSAPAAADPAGPRARIRLTLADGGWLQRALLGAVERFAIDRIARVRQAFAVIARSVALPEAGPARDAALLRWLGHVPRGPHGDRPRLDAAGDVLLPRYGTAVAPRWPAVPVEGDPLLGLASIEADFSVEGPPGQTAFVLQFGWTRR